MMRIRIAMVAAVFALSPGAPRAAAADRLDAPSTPAAAIEAQAAHESRPLWRLPLAGALIEDMLLLTPDRLLLALREDAIGLPNLPILLVDTRTGVERWRHEREQKDARWDLVLADSAGLLYRVDDGRKLRLVCLDAGTGAASWTAPLRPDAVPLADRARGTLLVVEPERSRVRLRSLSFADGTERWQREVMTAGKDAAPPHPLFVDADVLHFARGIERLAGEDGKPRWTRADLVVPDRAPDARLDGDALFVVVSGGTLVELDAASGATRHAVALTPGVDWDAIEASAARVYARGLRADGGAVLAAIDRETGRVVWAHDCGALPMSNVVEDGDRVFVATSGHVLALDAATGQGLGDWEATNTTRPYPVHLRLLGDRIVYIGELMVAGFDTRTGAKAWSSGWSPISNTASLLALDASLPRLRTQLAELNGNKARGAKTGPGASTARLEAMRFQNMGADYSRRADQMSASIGHSPGLSQNARSIARMDVKIDRHMAMTSTTGEIAQMRIEHAFERSEAMMAFQFAVLDALVAMQRAAAVAATHDALSRQLLFRRAVLTGYARMESPEYAYRPGMEFGIGGGPFVGVTVVQMTTGKTGRALLSPDYRDYGLWNVIDFERGVVYHHGIGLDPSRYDYMPARKLSGGSMRIVGNFVIATPITIPK